MITESSWAFTTQERKKEKKKGLSQESIQEYLYKCICVHNCSNHEHDHNDKIYVHLSESLSVSASHFDSLKACWQSLHACVVLSHSARPLAFFALMVRPVRMSRRWRVAKGESTERS